MTEVEMQDITLPAQTRIKVKLSITSDINFTAHVAQRRVNKLLLDRVGLFYGEKPSLVVGERLVWRVPVMFSTPTTGSLGQVGTLDVDAQTGEMLYTPEQLADFKERAYGLAKRTPHSTS
jgi:hypothetical protein